MDYKEFLQKQAEEEAEKLITDSDRQYYKTLFEKNEQAETASPVAVIAKKPWYKQWSVLSSIACAVCVLVIIVSSVLVNNRNGFLYKEENIVTENVTISNAREELKYFELKDNDFLIKKSYDNPSKSTLYFSFQGETDVAEVSLTVVVNEHYNYKFTLSEDIHTQTLDKYTVNYNKNENINLSGITYDYRGYIKVQTETAYFEYKQQIPLGEYADEAFFDDLQQLITLKA